MPRKRTSLRERRDGRRDAQGRDEGGSLEARQRLEIDDAEDREREVGHVEELARRVDGHAEGPGEASDHRHEAALAHVHDEHLLGVEAGREQVGAAAHLEAGQPRCPRPQVVDAAERDVAGLEPGPSQVQRGHEIRAAGRGSDALDSGALGSNTMARMS